MEELVKTFHIEANLLAAQIVNFVIVLLVLYKFAYGPILKTLNDRTKKIEKGLKDAEESQKKLQEITQKEKEVMTDAKKEAQTIIKKSEEEAKKNAEMIVAEAKNKTDKAIADAKNLIEQEKGKMLAEVKSEVAELVAAAAAKILGEKIDSEKDRELIERAITRENRAN
ncbi:MAG: ATP synthase F0 subunit B [Candidatus Moranbacteria bacterium RIFOXYA12_FULL_44_15]|nr:MAG: ATP synthase F0 subunit B [Candidatus Moranbacteria bacterium RIFOXYA12_FULL_44_15]OGI36531.1 MAG: ATP synthase F0 subunit B [Candidatus Moranbacteria bacterium RIFOXYA2_FULL_43_15]